jgi:ElaB/YqjD/DUF883 family membrane-anchored ribosome-binding protein
MTHQRVDHPPDHAKSTAETAKDRLRDFAETATEQAKHVVDNAQEVAGKIADQAREHGEKAQDVAKRFKPFVEKSLKEQPMTTLAAAAVVGFALGALWKK